jgi:alpha-beta hydrolase superfamily lysophospholipase
MKFPNQYLPPILILFFVIFASSAGLAQPNRSGIYVSSKDTIVINETKNDYLTYCNISNGRSGALAKGPSKLFYLGPKNKRPDSSGKDHVATLSFDNDNRSLVFRALRAKPESYHKLECSVKYFYIEASDGVMLSAKLVMPPARPKVPLVIIAQGSEQLSNDVYKESYLFASWGLATLIFEKRGVGKSGGKPEPDIFTQSNDISAAARIAASLPGIDSLRIGIWGVSQGGWVTPLAIIHQPVIRFAMILSGPATTAFEEEIAGIRKSLSFFGFKSSEIEQATSLLSEIYLTVEHADNWKNLDVLKNRFKEEKWYAVMIKQSLICSYFLGPNAEYIKSNFKALVEGNSYVRWCFYNPYRYLSRVQVPTLWMYGSEDKTIPVSESRNILQGIVAKCHRPFTIRYIKGMNHAAFMDLHTGVEDYDNAEFVSVEYLRAMHDWLRKNKVI